MTLHEPASDPRHWSTASFGLPADTSPGELDELGRHLDLCRLDGPGGIVQCAVQATRGFIAAHLVTSIAAAALLGALAWFAA